MSLWQAVPGEDKRECGGGATVPTVSPRAPAVSDSRGGVLIARGLCLTPSALVGGPAITSSCLSELALADGVLVVVPHVL